MKKVINRNEWIDKNLSYMRIYRNILILWHVYVKLHQHILIIFSILYKYVEFIFCFLLHRYSPDAKIEAPRWACALCGLGLFIYQSLDAIDGKQARRTNTANPLGELFDHGCDSISTVFVALSACIAVQLGYYPGWMFFQVTHLIRSIDEIINKYIFSVSAQWLCFTVPIGRHTCRVL